MPLAPIITCDRTRPKPFSADAVCIAVNSAKGEYYLCKDQTIANWLPLSEWLSKHLAERCGLLVPQCAVVDVPGYPGKLMFGSKWESGAADWFGINRLDIENPEIFSGAFAFDMLIQNDDRHVGNYLFLDYAGELVAKIMDHSRCWWHSSWPLPTPPLPPRCNTVIHRALWQAEFPFDMAAANKVIAEWQSIHVDEVKEIIDSAPLMWVNTVERTQILHWWGSQDWLNRIQMVQGNLP